jgi:hypothetical protein
VRDITSDGVLKSFKYYFYFSCHTIDNEKREEYKSLPHDMVRTLCKSGPSFPVKGMAGFAQGTYRSTAIGFFINIVDTSLRKLHGRHVKLNFTKKKCNCTI